MYPLRSPLRSSFTFTVELVTVALAAGSTIFNVGVAWSCSPRDAIRSLTGCGVSVTVNVCVAGESLAFTLDVFCELLVDGAVAHADNKTATKINVTDLINNS